MEWGWLDDVIEWAGGFIRLIVVWRNGPDSLGEDGLSPRP